MASACSIRVRGVVQGVGFRPFVYRLAHDNTLAGWVLNGEQGVEIFLEGPEQSLQAFVRDLKLKPPPAASIAEIEIAPAQPQGLDSFSIRESQRLGRPTVRVSPDLPVCDDCLRELLDPADRRFSYPYINCTNCGPRYTVIEKLPYDRPHTTMKTWPLDEYCSGEYHDPVNRRFHAQPNACAACGPHVEIWNGSGNNTARGTPGWKQERRGSEVSRSLEFRSADLRASARYGILPLDGSTTIDFAAGWPRCAGVPSRFWYAVPVACQMPRRSRDCPCAHAVPAKRNQINTERIISFLRLPREGARHLVLLRCNHTPVIRHRRAGGVAAHAT